LLLRWAIKYAPYLLISPAVVLGETGSRLSPGGYYDGGPFVARAAAWSESAADVAFWVVFVGCFFALQPSRRALHDLLAGTAVFETSQLADVAIADRGFEVTPLPPPSE